MAAPPPPQQQQQQQLQPPENAERFNRLTNQNPRRRSRCIYCLYCYLFLIATTIILPVISASIIYFIINPQPPIYSIESLTVSGLNRTSSSPSFNLTVKAVIPNRRISFYHEWESSVAVFYRDVKLSEGVLPVFYQPTNSVTVFETAALGGGGGSQILLTTSGVEHSNLSVRVEGPLNIKACFVKSWTINVDWGVTVTANAKMFGFWDCLVLGILWSMLPFIYLFDFILFNLFNCWKILWYLFVLYGYHTTS